MYALLGCILFNASLFIMLPTLPIVNDFNSSINYNGNNKTNPNDNRVAVFESLLEVISDPNLDNTTKMADVQVFIDEQKAFGFPVMYNDIVVFIYLSNVSTNVSVHLSIQPVIEMSHVNGTNLYYAKLQLFDDTRCNYFFYDENVGLILDPLNMDGIRVPECFGNCSEALFINDLRMPNYSDDGSYLFNKSIGSNLINESFYSSVLDLTYNITIYLPAGYNNNTQYKSFYTTDGLMYIELGNVKQTLDYLDYYNKLDPLIGIFVHSIDKYNDYYLKRQFYEKFIATELVPYIDSKYQTINNSLSRAHVGPELGSVLSGYIAYDYQSVFNLVGAQSPVFNLDSSILEYQANNDTLNDHYRFYINSGFYESILLYPAFKFAENLHKTNYIAKFRVFHQTAEIGQWRSTFGEMLQFLFSDECSDYSGSPVMYPPGDLIAESGCILPTSSISSTVSSISSSSTTNNADGFLIFPAFAVIIIVSIRHKKKNK